MINSARIWQSVYASLHRFAWAFVILFAAYSLDNSGQKNRENCQLSVVIPCLVRNSVLSWRVFHPMAKLAYLVFMISEPVSISLFASLHRPIYLTSGSAVRIEEEELMSQNNFKILTCVGCVIFSYFFAFLIDIGISRPSRNLLDLCLNRFCVTVEQQDQD